MAVISEAQDIFHAYENLSGIHKQVIHLKALIYKNTTRTVFLTYLNETGITDPSGRKYNYKTLGPILEELHSLGLLKPDYNCQPAILHKATVDALNSQLRSNYLSAIQDLFTLPNSLNFYYQGSEYYHYLQREIRLAIYENRRIRFLDASSPNEQKGMIENACFDIFFGVQINAEWFSLREEIFQNHIFLAKLTDIWQTDAVYNDFTPIIHVINESFSQNKNDLEFKQLLIDFNIVSGRLEYAKAIASSLTDSDDYYIPGVIACTHFLEGRNQEAIFAFQETHKRYKKYMGKRKVFFYNYLGIFYIFALLKEKSSRAIPEITELLAFQKDAYMLSSAIAYHTIYIMLSLLNGEDQKANSMLEKLYTLDDAQDPFSDACIAITQYWVDDTIAKKCQAHYEQAFNKYKNPLPGIAAIFAEILVRIAPNNQVYVDFLEQDSRKKTIRFLDILKIDPPWKRILSNLESYLTHSSGKNQIQQSKRLAWFFDTEHERIDVVEQSVLKNGQWSKGRAVALKRLYELDPKLDYVTPADRKVFKAICKEADSFYYHSENYYWDSNKALVALVGHPSIFDEKERKQHLEFVKGDVELIVQQKDKNYYHSREVA